MFVYRTFPGYFSDYCCGLYHFHCYCFQCLWDDHWDDCYTHLQSQSLNQMDLGHLPLLLQLSFGLGEVGNQWSALIPGWYRLSCGNEWGIDTHSSELGCWCWRGYFHVAGDENSSLDYHDLVFD